MKYLQIIRDLVTNFENVNIINSRGIYHTYKDIDIRANRLAWALLEIGNNNIVGKKFGIMHYNSSEYLEIIFGLQKIGGIPVPINIRYGLLELHYIFENAEIDGIFIHQDFLERIIEFVKKYNIDSNKIKIWVIGDQNTRLKPQYLQYEDFILKGKENDEFEVQIDDRDIGLILYTGGTTGSPKGVMLSFGNLYAATYAVVEHAWNLIDKELIPDSVMLPSEGAEMKFLIPTPFFHVSGIMPILTQYILHNLIVFPEKNNFSPEEICNIIETEKITSIFCVPTMYRMLLNYSDLDKWNLDSLSVIASGGSKLSRTMKIKLLEKFPKAVLIDGYGSTETIGTSTLAFIMHKDIPKIKMGYIGQIVAGLKMKIIDKLGEEVSDGKEGELMLKSNSNTIMVGYYGDENKTSSIIKDGWILTGDIVKTDQEGNVFYIGRKNDIITSGGEKIYPNEIEDFLRDHPQISDAAVLGMDDEIYGQVVISAIIPEKDSRLTIESVLEYCEGQIASFKKPRRIYFFDKFPLTKTQKLDKIKLKNLIIAQSDELKKR